MYPYINISKDAVTLLLTLCSGHDMVSQKHCTIYRTTSPGADMQISQKTPTTCIQFLTANQYIFNKNTLKNYQQSLLALYSGTNRLDWPGLHPSASRVTCCGAHAGLRRREAARPSAVWSDRRLGLDL